jgi:hypothetical protein
VEVKEVIMQAQIEKGTLLGEVLERVTTLTIKETTQFGIRAEVNYSGQFAGVYNATIYDTVTVFLKTDGTFDWEGKEIQSTNEGELIVVNGHGTGKMTGPKTYANEGEVIFMTQSPKLLWLNNKKGRVEITSDLATGESRGKVFSL